MLKNHLLLILRNAWRYRGYTLINTVGLAVGVACCLVIALFVHDEWTTDRFHSGAERIYLIEAFSPSLNIDFAAPLALDEVLLNETAHTERVLRLSIGERPTILHEGRIWEQENVYAASPDFFSMFAFQLAEGDVGTALSEPGTVVLTQQTADKYFPDVKPLGQVLNVGGEDLRVTGVTAPPPGNTFLDFSMLRSFAAEDPEQEPTWRPAPTSMFVRLVPTATAADLESDLALVQEKYMAPGGMQLQSTALADLYFESPTIGGLRGNRQYLWVFSAIAVLVLLIACVNYMNLASAQASRYAREVGVRKAAGARRGQLIARFLGESVLIASVALILSIGLTEVALPGFNLITEKTLAIPYTTEVLFWAAALLLALGTGIAAGSYPAFHLSKLNPVQVLKGQPRETGSQVWLRKALVVFQFAVTVVFLIGTFVVQRQLDFLQTRNLGLNPDQVIAVQLRGEAINDLEAFRQEVSRLSGVLDMAAGNPLRTYPSPITPEGAEEADMAVMSVGASFLSVLEVEIIEGRDFKAELETDADDSVLLNEAAVRHFGWNDGAVGRTLERYTSGFKRVTSTVVGVAQDFNFASMHEEVAPIVIQMTQRHFTLLVKVQAERTPDVIAGLEALHYQFAPDRLFKYEFLDERFEAFYRAEERLGQIFGFFSGLAVFVACLGLFGLAAFLAEQRTKEIGIRKVLGASSGGLLVLLTRDFVKLVLVAVVLAAPLAHVAMTRWLSDFAYRVDLGVGVFATAGSMALAIALVTVSYQALKVARANPIEALRYE